MSRRGENIYKRKDGRWEGRYYKGRDGEGKLKYGYIYGKTYYEVKQKLLVYKVRYQEVFAHYGEVSISFGEWYRTWLIDIKQKVKPSTYASYEYKLVHYVAPSIEAYPLNQLTGSVLQNLVDTLIGRQLKISTVRIIVQLIKQCLNAAIVKGLDLRKNPCETLILPKALHTNVEALTKKEQKSLEQVALTYNIAVGLPTLMALETGMRIGEISALRWKDIDFNSGLIYVRHTYQRIVQSHYANKRTHLILSVPKTHASKRIIPMTRKLKNLLMKHKKNESSEFVFFVKDKPCEPRLLTYYFHKLRQEAGLKKIHFHQLRHTFATRCLEAQADISSISALLGHQSTKMTLDIYTTSLLDQRIQTIKLLETI